MLIGGITDIDAECKDELATLEDDVEQGCCAAEELFEIMTMSNRFDTKDEDILTASDLVLLYQNMDIGTQLMSHTNKICQRTNQHIETVIYQGEEESTESELSEVNSDEDVRAMFQINNERLDFMNKPSYEETLCHKHGYLKLQNSNLKSKYNNRLLFDDPYIKEQLRKLNLIKTDFERSTLLDYISCKRLEDNYNFNMENIIQYVKHTIDQLKRISNGDYLTEKTRRKWRQIKKPENVPEIDNKTNKVLTNAISVPIHVEKKISKKETTWDELVHSEVDLTSLCKILEKKVVIEIPKLISGSYNLFSKCCTDSVIIRCKKQDNEINQCDEQNPQVDVVFQLQRSKSGHLLSNISSIMILQKSLSPIFVQDSNYSNELIPLPYKEIEEIHSSKVKILEIEEMDNSVENDNTNINSNNIALSTDQNVSVAIDQKNSIEIDKNIDETPDVEDISQHNVNCEGDRNINIFEEISNVDYMNPNELMVSMQQLNVQSAVPEENEEMFNTSNLNLVKSKRKSPVKTRIKSPYENKSLLIEERKRRRLLEIRERRERKKMALTETCKMVRNKYGKGVPMAQASNSVTKLSITNKSFYNSIFGESATGSYKNTKTDLHRKEHRKDIVIEIIKDETKTDTTPIVCDDEANPKTEKITNQNYLDETVTAVMCLDMDAPNTNSLMSDDTSIKNNPNFDIVNNFTGIESSLIYPHNLQSTGYDCFVHEECKQKQHYAPNIVPMNSPTRNTDECDDANAKSNVSIECRRSIDKIYNLMKNFGSNNNDNLNDEVDNNNSKDRGIQSNSTVPGSDSGTSLKHQSTSSNPSSFSFDKVKMDKSKTTFRRKHSTEPVIPKVVISSKLHIKNDECYNKERVTQRDRKLTTNLASKNNLNNPLKAISQLLHEFENVQKNKAKVTDDTKTRNSMIGSPEVRNTSRQGSSKRRMLRREASSRESVRSPPIRDNKSARTITKESRDRSSLMLTSKFDNLNVKHSDKIPKSMIGDIIDEAREARGEAVRGPSKGNFSRINALAQPRKLYVQAHSEEFQNKYGRNLMTDRLQRLASTPQTPAVEKPVSAAQNKLKYTRRGFDAASPVPIKHLEKPGKPINRRNGNSSPDFRTASSSANDIKSSLAKHADVRKIKKADVHQSETRKYEQEPSTISQKSSLKKSRVPFIPDDVDCDSNASLSLNEDSSSLGVKLHNIVHSMVNKDLTDLPEYSESTVSLYIFNKRDDTDSTFSALNQTDNVNGNEWKQAQSYTHVRFEDDIGNKGRNSIISDVSPTTNKVALQSCQLDVPRKPEKCNSIVEFKSSRCVRLPSIKDVGDEIRTCSKSKTLLNMPFSNVPLQVTTIGYAFPSFSIIRPNSIPLIRVISNHSPQTINKMDKLIQVVTHESREQALQTHFNPIREIPQCNLNESCQTDKCSVSPQANNEEISKASSTTCKKNFDSASSLDVLVNLLNEIQNITTCQTQMTSTDNSRQSNNITNNAVFIKDTSTNTFSRMKVATDNFNEVKKLESETSIFSLYVSNTGDICHPVSQTEKSDKYSRNVSCSIIPTSNKQDSADIGTYYKNSCTEVQTQVLPSTKDHVANVSNSMLNMFSQPSSQSVFRYQDFGFDLLPCRKIIEIPTTTNGILQDLNVNYDNDVVISKLSNNNNLIRPGHSVKVINYDRSEAMTRFKRIKLDDDPLIRVKRDILVTVYSVLVFTVFAALSFPEFLHQGF